MGIKGTVSSHPCKNNKPQARKSSGRLTRLGFASLLTVFCTMASAGPREQAQRMHERLTGVAPTQQILNDMVAAISTGTPADKKAAALIAINNSPSFYNVTLKNFVTPWTNEEQTVFAPLNDYTATVIGIVLFNDDFREILHGDYVYTGGASVTPGYSPDSNAHYEALENQNIDLSTALTKVTQPIAALAPDASAGVMTTRAAARAFFIDGTNRAMFRFTVLNHLCYDLEQIKDTTRPADRIRQDVSRSPGGDSRLFLNNCIGCHSGMDPMAQAFAYYNWEYKDADPMTEDDPEAGTLVYISPDETDPVTGTRVQSKYHINASNFKGGYATPDNSWTNYWRRGANVWLGWDGPPLTVTSGIGAKSLGQELANSDAFARCQVKKVFKAVCLRDPQIAPNPDATTNNDTTRFNTMVANFKGNYHLKDVFAEAAAYCSGPKDPIADPYGQ